MAKQGELWDDSALLNAFNEAMSKYKKMHGKKGRSVSDHTGECTAADLVDENPESPRSGKGYDNGNVASNSGSKMGGRDNIAPVKEKHFADSITTECNDDLSNSQNVQGQNEFSFTQGVDNYNQLLAEYYELEEKRQNILQQVQQYGGYNYQYTAEASGSGVQWNTSSTVLDHSVPTGQKSVSTYCPCCTYGCHCSAVSCSSIPACNLCGTCLNNSYPDSSAVTCFGKPFPSADGDVVKSAIGAAEKALSSIKNTTSVNSTVEGEKEKDGDGKMAQSMTSETDITVVLNAWYSAGFYTGKYLTEQSIARK